MLLPLVWVTGNLPARQRHLCAHWATTAPPHHSGCFRLQVMENPAKWLKDWESYLCHISTIPGRVGSSALHQQLSDICLSITCLPVAVPSSLVAVAIRDTSSQRTSFWFTFSKGVILFPFVVLSLKRRWFFPQKSSLEVSSLRNRQHWMNHMTMLQLIPRKQDDEIPWTTWTNHLDYG